MPQTSSTPIHEQFNHYYNTYVILRVFFPYYDPKVHGIDNTSFTAYFNPSSSFFAAYAQCIFWMLYTASCLYSGTRKIIRRHENLFSLYMLQTCVIDILTALLYCIGIYVVLSCAIALLDLSPVLVLYDETGLLAFLRLFIGAWVAITHPHLFIIEISMNYSYVFFFISTYPVLCFSIFSIACLVFLLVDDDIRIREIGSFLNDVLLFMWSIVQEIYDSILSSIFSFFLAHNIHKVFIKYLTWLRFSYYHEDMPDDRTRRHDEIFDPYYQSDHHRLPIERKAEA